MPHFIKFSLEDGSDIIIRPSGTEPKIKFYLSVKGTSPTDADEKLEKLNNCVNENGFTD
jgi:phosphoglucomutase